MTMLASPQSEGCLKPWAARPHGPATILTMRSTLFALALPSLLLGACATYAPRDLPAGASQEEIRRQLGDPTGRYTLPDGGARLEFARGPFGKHTYMVDLDAQGRVAGWRQVLTEAEFAQVQPGLAREELLRRLGRPAERWRGGRQGGEVWSWRYDTPLICQWFQVSVDDAGRVTSAGYAPDPLCDVRDMPE